MRIRVLLLVALGTLAFAIGCDEDEDTSSSFGGVTVRDEMGALISEDPDDWRVDCAGGKVVPDPVVAEVIAYPNPATISVAIRFSMPRAGEASIDIWAAGDRVGSDESIERSLVGMILPAGSHIVMWDLLDDGGSRVPPGIYRCQYDLNGCVGYGDIEISNLPQVSASARLYASEHWSVQRLMDACAMELDSPGMFYYNADSVDDLPQWSAAADDEGVLYFAIGRCDQFVFGWDDYVDPRELTYLGPEFTYQDLGQPAISLHREAYRGQK